MIRQCGYDVCGRKHYARGLCRVHYTKARDLGYFTLRYRPTVFPLAPAFDLAGLTVGGFIRVHRISGLRFAVWRSEGLTTFEADRVAVRLGMTPDQIWSDWWTSAPDEVLDDAFDAPMVLA